MTGGFNFEAMLDALATAVADKLRAAETGKKITPRLLSIEQAGEYLSRSAHSIRHLITARKLPVVKLDKRISKGIVKER